MSKKFQKTIVLENAETVTVTIKKPTNEQLKEADIYRAKAWNKAFKEGVMTKGEVEGMMVERGLWDDSKSKKEQVLTKEILDLERVLYRGNEGDAKPKLSEGRSIALEMREKRAELRDLISERISMDENTAESLADNSRFDYLVYCCSYKGDTEEPIFESYDAYNSRAASLEAQAAAQLLAQMVYDLDGDFEDKLPENSFLREFDLVNDQGQLVDPKTKELIDQDGRKVNELGHYLDDDGNRVDNEGRPIDEQGLYELVEYENDLFTEEEKSKPKKKTATKRKTTKAKAKKPTEVAEEPEEEPAEEPVDESTEESTVEAT